MAAQQTSDDGREPDYSGTAVPGRHEGRVAIITGASRGIGRAAALRLAREGARVVVAAKSDVPGKLPGTIHDTVRDIEQAGGEAVAAKVDVRDQLQVSAMVDLAMERWGRIDILFNNAGAIHLSRVVDTPPKRFDLMWQVNVRAAFLTAHHALPHMVRGGWGHVLNFSPELHTGPSTGMAPYMLTKLGMTRLALSIAEEHRDDNVAANALWPVTMIDTAAVRNNGLGDASQCRTPEIICDAVSELFAREPRECTGRMLTDEEVLREAGVDSFDRYFVEGAPPDHLVKIVGEESVLR